MLLFQRCAFSSNIFIQLTAIADALYPSLFYFTM